MRILLKKIDQPELSSFLVKRVSTPCLEDSLHYHEEYELLYVVKGKGKRLVGDSISEFKEGDLALIGANLPHLWRNSPAFYKNNEERAAEVIIVQFKKDFLGEVFFKKPETQAIAQLLERSKKGIGFYGNFTSEVVSCLTQLPSTTGIDKMLMLVRLLSDLAHEKQYFLSENSFPKNYTLADQERLNNVCRYVMDNFNQDIRLEQVAKIANLGTAPFCRYFKDKTRKTFTHFLNEVRIDHAAHLLIENKLNISEVSMACGFNSLTHFNRQFKKIKHSTPSEYREKYIAVLEE